MIIQNAGSGLYVYIELKKKKETDKKNIQL